MVGAEADWLAGVRVLITRPAPQAAGIVRLVELAGGIPVVFPTIEILEPEDTSKLDDVIARLDKFDIAIFISANAAHTAAPRIRERWRVLPSGLTLIAVGPASASALANEWLGDAITPAAGSNSEALLQLPQLIQVAGKHIVVFRGQGGRELLADSLRARGATITYAECYRRALPRLDVAPLLKQWRQGGVHVVLITSNEALGNLRMLLGPEGASLLRQTPCVVASERIAASARDFVKQTVVAAAAEDHALLAALKAWRAQEKSL